MTKILTERKTRASRAAAAAAAAGGPRSALRHNAGARLTMPLRGAKVKVLVLQCDLELIGCESAVLIKISSKLTRYGTVCNRDSFYVRVLRVF